MRIELETNRFYLARYYSEAVEAAGGLPVLIPLIPHANFVEGVMDNLDGVLLPGSDSDVDPRRYGREPHPRLGSVHPLKDETDLLVLAELEERAMPLFAICFGVQVLNVSRGGSLVQDIPSQLPHAINHQQGAPRDRQTLSASDSRYARGTACQDPSVAALVMAAATSSCTRAPVVKSGSTCRPSAIAVTQPRVIASVLNDPAPHIGQVYELTGPRSVDMMELADEFSRALFNRFVEEAGRFAEERRETLRSIASASQ